ncbi:uncharacterized protein DUF3168 [Rhodovulum imhoffii]|uniref:Uncharacterized protein DUF3168 n=1 Tax=Rhodovulum imhoffii TaxID=365340 RepID=A0A2T5BVB4_9RHOB|nr:DUF3168 domain-containing protein [Rhodovulum imhoffii]MBK5934232.1 hypothetical protein [Rhodovulum imhoffii]PTN03521.1 uncharacterized protein DUF3168 [Rhodovulum imhoffii]
MSYAHSAALQEAVYNRLSTNPTLAGLIGEAVFDAAPSGAVPGTYVTLGPEEVRDASDATGRGAMHRLSVSVMSDAAGFRRAKLVAEAVSKALLEAALILECGHLVAFRFERAIARREGSLRRIDLRFGARVSEE